MSWRFIVTGPAEKDLGRLDRTTVEAVQREVLALLAALDGPHQPPPGTKLLRHIKPLTWRIRVKDWRVVYRLDERAKVATIILVDHRSRVYKRLKGS